MTNFELINLWERYPALKTYLLIMKLSFILCFLGMLQVSASVYSQNKLTYSFENKSIKNVLEEIENTTELRFFYNEDYLDMGKRVTIEGVEVDINDFLASLLETSDAGFRFLDNNLVVIVPKEAEQQQGNVTGTVTDKDGSPLPAVTIVVTGTTLGTLTDVAGNYSIEIPQGAKTLTFSFIGMETQVVTIGTQTQINVTMAESAIGLDEVVVIGYGTQKKSDLTGSLSQVTNENFNKGVNSSIDQAIMGRASGVQIRQTSSEPGGGISIRIRGASSINAGNEPLFVIDGLPIDNSPTLSIGGGAGTSPNPNSQNPMSSLNPDNIQSIEILKDASATAIYGSRGANGVILITTKRGIGEKMQVDFNHYRGIQSILRKYEVLGTSEYIDVINALSIEKGNSPVFSQSDIESIGKGTDWQDEIFHTANVQNYNLSFSGKTNNINYFISGNYYDQEGTVKNSGIKKYILKNNLESTINDRLSINLNMNTSVINDNPIVGGISHNEFAGAIYSAVFFDPTEKVKDEDGNYTISPNLLMPNPVSVIEGIENNVETLRVLGNISMNYKITDALSTKINFGSDFQNARRDVYNSKLTLLGLNNNGMAYINSLNRSNILGEYTLSYSKTLKGNSLITALAGATYQTFTDRSYSSSAGNFPTDITRTDNLSFGDPSKTVVASNKNANTLLSYLGRVSYNLYDRFLFTGSIRADGSSRFGENNKYGYFPSLAFAWKLHQEKFIPDFFSELKLRASWGMTGNQEISNYASLSTYSAAGYALFNESTYVASQPSRLSNPNLKWETTEQFNIGIDADIFKGRISGSFDYFVKNTRDMLIYLPTPLSTGYTNQLRNVGKMNNIGFEAIINSRNIEQKNFKWNTILNFSAIRNEVKDIGELSMILMGEAPGVGENSTIVKPGLPLNSYYGYKITGIFQTAEEVAGSAQINSKPGNPIFEDTNSDGIINSNDKQVLGNPFPDFTFGIINNFNYKNFELSINFNGQYGNDLLNATELLLMYPSNFRRNRSSIQTRDRWTPQNPGAKWPSGTDPNTYGGGAVSNYFVEDASYIRLQSLQLSYILPTKKLNFIDMVRIDITGQNLFTITNYTGGNPDSNVYGQGNYHIDFFSYPLAKIWTMGINMKF